MHIFALSMCLVVLCEGKKDYKSVKQDEHRPSPKREYPTAIGDHRDVSYHSLGRHKKGHKNDPSYTDNSAEIRGVYFVVNMDDVSSRYNDKERPDSEDKKRLKRNVKDEAVCQDCPVVTSLRVDANVINRFSTTKLKSVLSNTDDTDKEASFTVQIPEKAFISNFTMLIGNELYIAEVKEKGKAEEAYEEAKRRNETAGKVSSQRPKGKPTNGMEMFSVSVNVASQSQVEFTLTYLQLLERKLGMYSQIISVRPNQVVNDYNIKVRLEEPQGIIFVNASFDGAAITDPSYRIDGDGKEKILLYSPSEAIQKEHDPDKGINGDIIVNYDVLHAKRDVGMICVDGDYFIHYFSPTGLDPLNKNVVFVVDVSGSMSGQKIEQTLVAMLSILDILRPADKFQLILFDDKLRYWPVQQMLIQASGETVVAAKAFLTSELKAQGGTNINDALLEACRTLKNQGQWGSNIIVFLTDGQPTAGETRADTIISNVVEEASNKISIFSLGFGEKYSLDFELLRKISLRTGVAEGAVRIYPGIDAQEQLSTFFKLVNTPLIFNVKMQYPVDVVILDSITQNEFPQYFDGSELVIAGKLNPNRINKEMAVSVGGVTTMEIKFEKSVSLELSCPVVTKGYMENVYAYMMVKYLLIQEEKTDLKSTQEQIRQDALKLALDNNLVTPLTSLVITQDTIQENIEEDFMSFSVMSAGSAASIQTWTVLSMLPLFVMNVS